MFRFESNLKGGKQSSDGGRDNLEYGVSITDGETLLAHSYIHADLLLACVDWEMTVVMLDDLNTVGLQFEPTSGADDCSGLIDEK